MTSIEFVNNANDPIGVYWISYSGMPVFYNSLLTGQAYVQQTYIGPPWVILDETTNLARERHLPSAVCSCPMRHRSRPVTTQCALPGCRATAPPSPLSRYKRPTG